MIEFKWRIYITTLSWTFCHFLWCRWLR